MICAAFGKAEEPRMGCSPDRNPIVSPSTVSTQFGSSQPEASQHDFLRELGLSAYAPAVPVETKRLRYLPPAVPLYASRGTHKAGDYPSGSSHVSPAQDKPTSQLPESSNETAGMTSLLSSLLSGRYLCFSRHQGKKILSQMTLYILAV